MKPISRRVQSKARKIKLLLLDVDGVLTDGGIIIDDRGVEAKRFDVRDGQGITLLLRAGIQVGFMTGRSSNVVRRRARELGVTRVYQAVQNKADAYDRIKKEARLKDEEIAYMGDDLADVPVLRRVGLALTVRNCWSRVTSSVHYVTQADGGFGAVREVSEIILTAQGKWDEIR